MSCVIFRRLTYWMSTNCLVRSCCLCCCCCNGNKLRCVGIEIGDKQTEKKILSSLIEVDGVFDRIPQQVFERFSRTKFHTLENYQECFFSSFILMCIRKVIDWLIVIIILSFASFTYSLPLSSLINKTHLFDVDQIYLFNIAFETLAYLGATHPQPHNLFGFNSFSFFGCPDVMSMYSAYSPS